MREGCPVGAGHDGKVQEPLDVGTTVEDPPTELDGDEIARTRASANSSKSLLVTSILRLVPLVASMNVKRSVISLSLKFNASTIL